MPELFTVKVSGPPAHPVVAVSGELDMATAGQLRAQLDILIAAGAAGVVVDCRQLAFCDAAGLEALLSATTRLPTGVSLRDAPLLLRRVRDLLNLQDLLPDAAPA